MTAEEARAWRDADGKYFSHGGEADPPVPPWLLVRGDRSTVWDVDGNEYLDAHAGAWLSQIGHGRTEMAEVAAAQMSTLEHFTTHAEFSSIPAVALAQRLVELSGIPDGKVRYACSGSEADDDALQIARNYQLLRGMPDKNVVLTLAGCYHGHTYGGLELSGRLPSYMSGATVSLTFPDVLSPERFGPDGITEYCVAELERTIERIGAHRIAALFGEPIFGPAGMVGPPKDYWPRMCEVLQRHDILWVADEVVTGLGRTGRWFGSHHYGVTPDVMVLAKGLASGYAPIAAIVISGRVAKTIHGTHAGGSYAGHTTSCALALRNIEIIERENLCDNAAARGDQFQEELAELLALPCVRAVTGVGLMIGVHLQRAGTPGALRPGPAAPSLDTLIRQRTGVILMGGYEHLLITPPLIFTPAEVTRTVGALHGVLADLSA
ncbi:aspartate aminotransferase family protein [Mycobacterium sp. AT1]|uniref:aminotransferase family protein n=1 Tax=Mycobacterium sp. AT1 TaxID=1961706 RepID=UPI00114E18E2|nr:aminotransferase class III-fold pyridoxal phosphate-dependent enzyme [Mycobacterium sp. AT1]